MTEPTGLPPEQEAVRRLLADARHDGATPPEVVARLDETLASLVAERREARTPGAPVVDLGARRRRLAGMGLLAAAAVVVAGVAVGQALPRMQGSSDAGSSADSATSEREFSSQEDSAGNDAGSSNLAEAPQDPQAKETYLTPGLAGYPNLLTFGENLDDDLVDLRATESSASATDESTRSVSCDLRGIGPGRRVAAQIDGSLGLVVFRRSVGDAQQVDLYVCGDPQAVRTLTLPAP
ncbi:hypothetical protein [Nocardioides zhouii]|uniref:Uncharacterized protein n=1 Tax=Nocardioides zhouii TaxID=1168729 RepID=A0A4Q2T241_9ACTN|nr:hypothetical protein [Nocardioides zhouii]RYC11050.1 hypothetical protein EUA94_10545 [Nocardioides zhouii]